LKNKWLVLIGAVVAASALAAAAILTPASSLFSAASFGLFFALFAVLMVADVTLGLRFKGLLDQHMPDVAADYMVGNLWSRVSWWTLGQAAQDERVTSDASLSSCAERFALVGSLTAAFFGAFAITVVVLEVARSVKLG